SCSACARVGLTRRCVGRAWGRVRRWEAAGFGQSWSPEFGECSGGLRSKIGLLVATYSS
ncbi:hypothetical protein A2U01_0091102, partial [Trifolium medium]|nr:hypothetical protein [Trifolium medium]